MSKKDYVATAAIIAAMDGTNRARHDVAEAFARHYGSDNPRFDYVRFMDACAVKYTVRRRYEDGRPSKHIVGNLSLSAAQAHCHRDDTRGILRTGVGWFDGYDAQ